jgi:hypothetical protein
MEDPKPQNQSVQEILDITRDYLRKAGYARDAGYVEIEKHLLAKARQWADLALAMLELEKRSNDRVSNRRRDIST